VAVTPPAPGELLQEAAQFCTTNWSLILSSAGETKSSEQALGQLCRIYWRPIFAFICRRGHSVCDAQDLTQEFFVRLLTGRLLANADPARGRFRSLLLKALQNFLVDSHSRRHAQKRGGKQQFVSWDDWMAEGPTHLNLPVGAIDSWSAERLFDARWAATIAEQALRQLREECEARGRGRVFDTLSSVLASDREDVSYARLATDLGVSEMMVKRLLHQLRQRYRALLRREVARTVSTQEELDDEIRYLCSVLAGTAAHTDP
jgi:RNA polymerase sigma factor (sigma-70 family)